MKYRALVADSKTGREFETLIPGEDEAEARKLLKQRGLMVSSIEPAIADESGFVGVAGSHTAALPTPPTPRKIILETEDRYPAMTRLSSVLLVIAVLAYLGGSLCILVAFMIAADRSWQADHPALTPSSFGLLGGQTLFSGLMLHAIALALIALRDIAENSFRD
jgi:hypothetical protein